MGLAIGQEVLKEQTDNTKKIMSRQEESIIAKGAGKFLLITKSRVSPREEKNFQENERNKLGFRSCESYCSYSTSTWESVNTMTRNNQTLFETTVKSKETYEYQDLRKISTAIQIQSLANSRH